MHFLNYFKKQNWGIKIGYISLVVSLLALALALILIGTAKFVPQDSNRADQSLIGNGFNIINNYGISYLLSSSGYSELHRLFINQDFTSAPLVQLIAGVVFLVIMLPIAGGISILALLGGYFKRWLYT